MAPGQNTFSIIPNAPCAINAGLDSSESRAAVRPMTTKQARKAYQKKNTGPKLSKAEQRRRDLFEQDRIRKEFEKERNQARARAARDKKKEKEEKERAERKKKGLPLVDVHPSQDTIAWFVRGDRRKQETAASPVTAGADDSDSGTLSAQDEPEPPPKKQKTEFSVSGNPELGYCPSSAGILGSLSAAQSPNTEAATDDSQAKGHSTPEHSNLGLDNPEIVDELLDELVNVPSSLPIDGEATRDSEPLLKEQDAHVPSRPSPPKSSDGLFCSPIPPQKPPPEQKAEDSASLPSVRQPLQTLVANEVNLRSNGTPTRPTPSRTKLSIPMEDPIQDSPMPAPRKSQSRVSAPPSFRHPKTPMGPPRLPPKFKAPSHTPASVPRTPQFLIKQSHAPKFKSNNSPTSQPHKGHTPQRTGGEQPPMSTQLFMFSHLDDFFPSPSQEAREVFGEPKLSIGKGGYQLKPKPAHPTRSSLGRNPLSNLTPGMLNINRITPEDKDNRTGTRFTREAISTDQSRNSTSFPPTVAQSSDSSEALNIPFFSTQDFFLSSQDIKDLEDETPPSLGVEPREDPGPSNYAPETVGPLPEAIRSKPGIDSITPVPRLATKQVEKSELNSGTKSIDTCNGSSHFQGSGMSNEGNKGTTVVGSNMTTPSVQGERIRGDVENGTRPTMKQKPENTTPRTTNQSDKPHTPGTMQMKMHVVQPRASPKPFFGSSSRDAQYKYIMERNKTTKWEDPAARQKARQELERLRRSEDERLDSLLRGTVLEDGDSNSVANCASRSKAPTGSAPRTHSQPKGQPQPPTVNQLSRPSQKKAEPNEDRQRRSRSRSSYEVMLEELKELSRKENQKQGQQAPAVPASQETDYGDAGLDDVLYEML
ncbi:hypothetical protein F4818DRAFT_263184 [Hypoxylon cercidicola]|nr:hypothetical protein F4818DRAFT_263184 [Hypoxylon cercidicola]